MQKGLSATLGRFTQGGPGPNLFAARAFAGLYMTSFHELEHVER